MKVTYNLLKELVDFSYTPEELSRELTMLGLEVEALMPVELPFSGVVTGRILDIKPHPNAQKLQLCRVTTEKEELQIVCGAFNIRTGDLIPVAKLGAILADNTKIIQRNIRGIDSFGMLCSEKELGLNEVSEGILILSFENTNIKNIPLGIPLEEAIGLNDIILEINVTPNRPDALSIIGIAREISSLTGNPLKIPKIDFKEEGPSTKKFINIDITAWDLCPRYTARVIQNVTVKPSPFWLRYRLQLLGTRSINNVVDVTNYVLAEFGQPLHAFDYKTIEDSKIIVRTAKEGEEIITIDNEKRKLDSNMLVIADGKKPIAVAGVIGGKETEVGEKTTDILLESAYFEPAQVRKTSKKFCISTESSYRFERGIDPEIQISASNRAAQLIQLIAGGNIQEELCNLEKNIPKQPSIEIDQEYCRRIIGIDISPQKISSILTGLGCNVKEGKKSITITPPSWRRDITAKIDLMEEIVRVYGYSNIPSTNPEAQVSTPIKQKIHELLKKLYILLTGMGMNEIVSYSFINPKDLSLLRMPSDKYIKLENPIDKNVNIMRTTLTAGIINNILYNIHRGNDAVHIFEIGRCFFPQENKLVPPAAGTTSSLGISKFLDYQIMPKEDLYLAIGICGNPGEAHWRKTQPVIDFFYLKGIIEEVMRKLFIKDYQFQKKDSDTFCPGKSCNITIGNKEIGKFGELHPQVVRNFDIKAKNIYIAELNISLLLEMTKDIQRDKFEPLPKFPQIRRDISIILDKQTQSYDIIEAAVGIGLDIIEDIKIFDVYEGHPIPEGKKSIAYAVFYRSKDRTLTDEEVDNTHNVLRCKLLETIKGEIRE